MERTEVAVEPGLLAVFEEAARSKKLVVFAMGNIHAGEVDGKEGLLMLARDIALAKDRPLLKDIVLVIAPIFNADGNEKFGKNRPSQAGHSRRKQRHEPRQLMDGEQAARTRTGRDHGQ